LLSPDDLPTVLGDAAIDLLESESAPAALVSEASVAAYADAELGAAMVALDVSWGSTPIERRGDEFARAMSRACLVAELLSDGLVPPAGSTGPHPPVIDHRRWEGR